MTKQSAPAKRWIVLALSAATVAACNRHEAAPPGPEPSTPAPSGPARQPVAAPPVVPDHASASDDPSGDAIVGEGRWAENRQYRFRLEAVAHCGPPAPVFGPAEGAAPVNVGRFRGETTWVGAVVSVEAKQRMFLTPRDLELRRGGVILTSAQGNEPLPAGCAPLLPARRLHPGESTRGFALFEVPRSFRAKTEDPIVFSYRPTRWGGARKVDVPIPECFDACGDSPAGAIKTAGRSRTTLR